MTKSLHKDSLQKIDNPHQWMIDGARMKLIQQIKAEMERRIKSWQTRGEHSPEGQGKDTCVSRVTELTDLLSFLDTLQEQPVELDEKTLLTEMANVYGTYTRPDYIEENTAEAGCDFECAIARHFYELGRQSKPEVSEGLEEEVQHQVYDHLFDLDGVAIKGTSTYASVDDVAYIARHFTQWGAEHLKK